MSLDAVFGLKDTTPAQINVVVNEVITNERKHWAKPRRLEDCFFDNREKKIKEKTITEPPLSREQRARLVLMAQKCNSPRHLFDLDAVLQGKKPVSSLERSKTMRGCGYTMGDLLYEKEPANNDLKEELEERRKPPCKLRGVPRTRSEEVGWFAQNPMDKRWRTSDRTGQRWRKAKNECPIVEFGRLFYETTGVNAFSRAAQESLFNGKPS